MPYDSPTLAALARLIQYNSNAFNASTNPRGFSNGGHRSNFPASLTDSAIVANSLSATADNAATFIDEANAIAATIPTLASELQAGLVGLNLREYYVVVRLTTLRTALRRLRQRKLSPLAWRSFKPAMCFG
jgi:hypothetical protein